MKEKNGNEGADIFAVCENDAAGDAAVLIGRKKHRKLRIFLIIVLIIAVVCAALAVWQRENISAVLYGLQHDTEDIEQEIAENEKAMDDAVSDYDIPDTEVSDEIAEGIVQGTLNINEVVNGLLKQQNSDTSSDTESTSDDTDAEVQRLITKLYVLRSSYTSQLNSLISSAKSEFLALPAEQQTDTAKRRIISAKISQGSSLEASCDAQVSSIVSQIRSKLSAAGRSTELADQVQSAYQREKQLQKSYYMSLV